MLLNIVKVVVGSVLMFAVLLAVVLGLIMAWDATDSIRNPPLMLTSESVEGEWLSFIIIDPAGMVPLVALRRTKKPGSARAGTCRDHAINGPRSWTTQSRGTPAIDAQRLNWLRRRRAIRSGGGAHPLAATRRLLRSVMVGA